MLSYIEICTLIDNVFLRSSKISQKAYYLTKGNSCTQYKSVYTGILSIAAYIQVWLCIPHYILVWAHEYCCKTVYTCINTVYLGTSQYIRVYTRIKHFAKMCTVLRFEPWISCTLHGCSDRYTTRGDVYGVYHMIYVRLHITFRVWLQTSGAEPAAPPAPAMMSAEPCWHGFEAGVQVLPARARAARLPVSAMCSKTESVCPWSYVW
jgi:hypothetical protein